MMRAAIPVRISRSVLTLAPLGSMAPGQAPGPLRTRLDRGSGLMGRREAQPDSRPVRLEVPGDEEEHEAAPDARLDPQREPAIAGKLRGITEPQTLNPRHEGLHLVG